MNSVMGRLPSKPVDRLTKPLARFLRIEAAAGAVLLICVAVALIVANSSLADRYAAFWHTRVSLRIADFEIGGSLLHWINDGLMTLFFFTVALELKREMVLGELRDLRIASLSLFAALGGMAVPAAFYLLVASAGSAAHGWGVVMATDTAFVIACLAVLGSRVPLSLRVFLLSLAIFDDIGAIVVVAIGYGSALNWVALGCAAAGLAVIGGCGRAGIRSLPLYAVLGIAVWTALHASGVHPTLAGVILGLMTPARSWVSSLRLQAILRRVAAHPPGEHWRGDTAARADLQRAGVATHEALSPVERLEIMLHPWVAFGVMPLFALANAGVEIIPADLDHTLMAAVLLGLVAGKPLGIVVFAYVAVLAKVALKPAELSWGTLIGGGCLTGIGFTMSLFIADLAFGPQLLPSAKLAILAASTVSAVVGLSLLFWLSAKQSNGYD